VIINAQNVIYVLLSSYKCKW